MTNPNKTLIVSLLDRSGSMEQIRSDIEGAHAAFIQEQTQVSESLGADHQTLCTLVQFDSHQPFELVYDLREISTVPPLALEPRGMTPLNDALAATIKHVGWNLEHLAEVDRPGHVYFVVLTDGLENHFLGVGIDAFAVSAGYGMLRVNTVPTGASGQSASVGYGSLSANIGRSRTGGQ